MLELFAWDFIKVQRPNLELCNRSNATLRSIEDVKKQPNSGSDWLITSGGLHGSNDLHLFTSDIQQMHLSAKQKSFVGGTSRLHRSTLWN
ncbi:hypothetical protein KIN20_031599 [Parelaphostrongylus tenuis]|uniref:Uncharacterized protein n=1 Tax=Parelaphostrongylus tenuis TaxID=148309 RepID=A0AAD5R5P1_PARTN|nr:hypothetical protein KIN20_031599 [Parelaphostrongylus tenuis]